jgi:hypothetical protein
LWGQSWKDYALTLEQQNAQLTIASTLAYGMLRSERRKRSVYQTALALGAVAFTVNVLR